MTEKLLYQERVTECMLPFLLAQNELTIVGHKDIVLYTYSREASFKLLRSIVRIKINKDPLCEYRRIWIS